MSIGFAGAQHATFPAVLPLVVGAVRKDLSLQAQTGTVWVRLTTLTYGNFARKIVSSIKLDPRLIGMNLHYPP